MIWRAKNTLYFFVYKKLKTYSNQQTISQEVKRNANI